MPLLLILIFPLAEIAAFIIVGQAIGVLATLALIVVSSVIGLTMLRDAGVATLARLQRSAGGAAAVPAAVLAEGGARMLAGLLFLIPGFLSDIAGIVVLIPALRRVFFGRTTAPPRSGGAASGVIDGDFRRLDG